MLFQLPDFLADEAQRQELERASVTGGQDNMPYPTDARIENDCLVLTRESNESGNLQLPWSIDGVGQLMATTATLIERASPYHLTVELARGKLNQVRSQAAEWSMGPFEVPFELKQGIRDATTQFSQALMRLPDSDADSMAQDALLHAHQSAHALTHVYIDRVFELRHLRQPKFETWQSCRLEGSEPTPELTPRFLEGFNCVGIPFPWQQIEPKPKVFSWKAVDRAVDWATSQNLKIIAGPLIDFGGRNLPDWLWEQGCDLATLSQVLGEHVEAVVRRYQARIRTWQISAGSNVAGVLASRDEELIWLTVKIAEAVRRVNPQLEIVVGLAQPWGDYLAEQQRMKTPFIFADDMLRTGVKLSGLDLEFIMGVSPRGNYCRDILDLSRLLDLYALLGVPLQTTLGYPSSTIGNEFADPDQRVGLGAWRDGYTNDTQADWAASFAALALCKPHVRTVQWCHWSDAQPHVFPNCGLIDATGAEKPALQTLTKLRSEHLK